MPQRATSSIISIDRDKLRAAIRKLGDEHVFNMLDDAIDRLPQSELVKLVGQYRESLFFPLPPGEGRVRGSINP